MTMTMAAGALSLTEQIADRIRHDIKTGRYAPGDQLPTEEQLVEREKVSRGTIRNAYQRLTHEGLVVTGARGRFVRSLIPWDPLLLRLSDPENNLSTDDGPQDTWSRSVREQGRIPEEEIRTEVIFADGRAHQHLRLSESVPLLARRRFRYVDGQPSCTADSFYLREHVAGTAVELPQQVYPGVYAVFAAAGLPWVRTVDEVGTRAPTREEARELRITGNTWVIEVIRVSYTTPELPVRMTAFVLPGDRYKALYEHRGESPQ
jgi:GntR family transcriptional regulator